MTRSEELAFARVEAGLRNIPGQDLWLLLTNLSFSSSDDRQSDEIDIVAVGPPGVRLIEIKHWHPGHAFGRKARRHHSQIVNREAEKLTRKCKRVGATLRQRFSVGYVRGALLLTRTRGKWRRLQGRKVRGVPAWTIDEWRGAVGIDQPGQRPLSGEQVQMVGEFLDPLVRVTLGQQLGRLCGYRDLQPARPAAPGFHRVFRGKHQVSGDPVHLHLYDLTAEGATLNSAKREYEALYKLSKYAWSPTVRDSFQSVREYPSELAFFTVGAPGLPTLEDCALRAEWGTGPRLEFAARTLHVLEEMHSIRARGGRMLHRNLTPRTILVRDLADPVLTGFELARIPTFETVSTQPGDLGTAGESTAPEIREQGLAAATSRSDTYSLYHCLEGLFTGRKDDSSRRALGALRAGRDEDPERRTDLGAMAELLQGLAREEASPKDWQAGQTVRFRGNDYRLDRHLGSGGIGKTFKVIGINPRTGSETGAYVGKFVAKRHSGTKVLDSYTLARPHLGRHPGLSAIFEVASSWSPDTFVALMTWVPGQGLDQFCGHPEDAPGAGPGEVEAVALRWLREAAEALNQLHRNGLVHGDVSPRNIIVTENGRLVLTDYDLTAREGDPVHSPGTPRYCSPARQEGRPAGTADDLFALAASLFEVLFDRSPFAGNGPEAKSEGLRWKDGERSSFPRLAAILDRNTAEAPRYHSAGDLLADVFGTSVPAGDGASGGPNTDDGPNPATDTPPGGLADFAGARERVVHWLRQQLIGPAPGCEEWLNGTWPVDRYPTGALYPQLGLENGRNDHGPESSVDLEGFHTAGLTDDGEEEEVLRPDSNREQVAGKPARRRPHVPLSAVGFSCFVKGKARLEISVRGAHYRRHPERDARGRFQTHNYSRSTLPEALLTWEDGVLRGQPSSLPIQVSVRPRRMQGGVIYTVSMYNRLQVPTNATPTDFRRTFAESTVFEASLECVVDSGRMGEYPRVPRSLLSEEEEEIELQYRHRKIYAVGHGVAVDWDLGTGGPAVVRIDFLPSVEVSRVTTEFHGSGQGALDLRVLARPPGAEIQPLLKRFAEGYRDWIRRQDGNDLRPEERAAAVRLRKRMRETLARMEQGIELLAADPCVARAFQFANEAILEQFCQADRVRGRKPAELQYAWRPFQLAFLLTAVSSVVREDDDHRDLLDLIWFPTGGGKTEAYLGLIALLIAWRRLKYGDHGTGTTALMRYTLRLLTSQQFERAARMIFSLELLRRKHPDELGTAPVSVGMWVGDSTSPNRFGKALGIVEDLRDGKGDSNRLVLSACPWCGEAFDERSYAAEKESFGFLCHSTDCSFGGGDAPLPCNVVDDALYRHPPSLLIATIDKFARLPWEERAGAFFGRGGTRPPELVIQDELHLVTGPLGSVAGIYEAGLDTLLRARGVRPKYVASTATIRMAKQQVRKLYGRDVRVFPPPGLSCDDSYFARSDEAGPGRLYVGFMAQMLGMRRSLSPLAATMLAAPPCLFSDDAQRDALMDAWWTSIVYHTSLNGVGTSNTQYEIEVRDWVRRITRPDPGREDPELQESAGPDEEDASEPLESAGPDAITRELLDRASPQRIGQLTSIKRAHENAATFQRLEYAWDEADCLDVVLATNMVSVGLDVARLAVMILNGQPHTTAEYIQATSRVGRADVPGVVLVNYFRHQASSLFHYEYFRPYHESFYRFVEPSSVTPYTYAVRSRALHAALVMALRHGHGGLGRNAQAREFRKEDPQVQEILALLKERCLAAEGREGASRAAQDLEALVEQWQGEVQRLVQARRGLKYDSQQDQGFESLLTQHGDGIHTRRGLWPTLNSMRNVESTAVLRVKG